MKVLDKITLFLSVIVCGHWRELLKSQKKIKLRVYTDKDFHRFSTTFLLSIISYRTKLRKH
jgi:hypothetical protein